MSLVLLDRDGVINHDSPDYIREPDDWEPIPGSLEAIAALKRAGFAVAVCTNQAGLARGLITAPALAAIHERMLSRLGEFGATLDGIFFCPHGPGAGCACRKPAPGLILEACRVLGYAPEAAIFVGDSARDLEAARRAGARPILVETGNGRRTLADGERDVETHTDLAAAARAFLKQQQESP